MNTFEETKEIFKSFEKYYQNERILTAKLREDIYKMEPELMKKLLENDNIKKEFFTDIDGTFIFDKDKFLEFINNKQYLEDSYTKFENKIGLAKERHYLNNESDVVLDFPYKDCVLVGGATKEDDKRNEVFINEIIGRDQINYMSRPKVLTKAERHTKEGVEENITEFKDDDNLIIKGNNYIALQSLLPRYEGKIKCIYIDIPYNTGNDDFNYNDSFNHSTWLVFMKNRLEILKKLLRKDGVICIQCDDNEQAYLKVLCDEILGRENFVNCICVKMSELKGFKMGNLANKYPKLKEYLLVYTINKSFLNINIEKILKDNLNEYSHYYTKIIKNYEKDINQWELDDIDDDFDKIANSEKMVYLVTRDSKINDTIPLNKFKKITNNNGKENLLYNDNGKIKTALVLAENMYSPLGDIWMDISTINLNKESVEQLENGQKPEKLLERIIKSFSKEKDIILDSFLGSGTTARVALKTNRHFIGIEQIDRQLNMSIKNIENVIKGDNTVISVSNNWQGGGSFVYCELKDDNQKLIDEIQNAPDEDTLQEIKEKIFNSDRIIPYLSKKDLEEATEEFDFLPFETKQEALIKIIDKNRLYVNYCDKDDEEYNISDIEKEFSKSFYGDKE